LLSAENALPPDDFVERIQQYMFKAVHEAKVNLSWVNSNPEYLQGLQQFIARIFSPQALRRSNSFWSQFLRFLPAVCYFGAINSLSQTLLKIASPGIPDIYQGNELWDFSLVDPDSRRQVDFALRQALLQDLQARADHGDFAAVCSEVLQNWQDGRAKLWLTMRALSFRREHPELFRSGFYFPLDAVGNKREHVIAFARIDEEQNTMVIAAAPRLSYMLMNGEQRPPIGEVWADLELQLPRQAPNHFFQLFSGRVCQITSRSTLLCREIFADFPVALLAAR